MFLAEIIDGKAIAAKIREEIADDIKLFHKDTGITPGLAVILVGDDPASKLYVHNKIKACKKVGINSFEFYPSLSISELELCDLIEKLNVDERVHGILVQLPLPNHINPIKIINTIDPRKDVDGFTAINIGKLITTQDCFVPCTPQGCLILIKSVLPKLDGLNALIIGRSNIVGKPMSYILLQENCTVTIAHSYTKNIDELSKKADILIAAAGQANLVRGDWIKPGAIIIDVGINYTDSGKIVGDVDFNQAKKIAKAISPVPGGVGPMTVTCLLKNTLKAARQFSNVKKISS